MLEYLLLIVGFIFLIKGAQYFVDGSSQLAKRLGVSSLVIGLTVVAFGTSMPEFVINIFSAIEGHTELALGTIIGSNISNTLLILGISSMLFPLLVHKSTVWNEIPLSLFSTFLLFILINDSLFGKTSKLSQLDGIIMLSLFCYFLYYIYSSTQKSNNFKIEIQKHSDFIIALMILGGLVAIFFGGNLIVKNALIVASTFGISDFLISATVIAIGSSLPELVVSLVAIFKKNVDLAVGNIVGSNIFNILYVLGSTALIQPIYLPGFVNFDLVFLMVITALLFLFMFTGKKHKLERWEGAIFILLYIAYFSFIVFRG
jgi:cation:H+ antiporter